MSVDNRYTCLELQCINYPCLFGLRCVDLYGANANLFAAELHYITKKNKTCHFYFSNSAYYRWLYSNGGQRMPRQHYKVLAVINKLSYHCIKYIIELVDKSCCCSIVSVYL